MTFAIRELATELRTDILSAKTVPALSAGFTSGLGLLVAQVAFGSFIFSGALAPYSSQGVGLILFGNFAACLLVALVGDYRGAIAGLSPALVIVMATIAGTIEAQGEIAWKVPFGEGSRALREHPLLQGVALPERLGTRGNSGAMVTGGGLVFVGGGAPYLYAFDRATGAEVWRGATPYRTFANPMTYRAQSGRQFIVIATGRERDAALVAFARRRASATST